MRVGPGPPVRLVSALFATAGPSPTTPGRLPRLEGHFEGCHPGQQVARHEQGTKFMVASGQEMSGSHGEFRSGACIFCWFEFNCQVQLIGPSLLGVEERLLRD